MSRIIAIGDIHGCNKTLRQLVLNEISLRQDDELVFIGDYVDRGPDSKGVVDFILDLKAKGYRMHTLRGNHEQLMLESMMDLESIQLWHINGGRQTLESFGVNSFSQLEEKYKQFFLNTEHFWATDQYVFVHAGLDFGRDDPFENKEAMLWIRDFQMYPERIGGRKIIHGHTPMHADLIPKQKESNIIDIDGGCVYKSRPGYGVLFALCLPEMRFVGITNIDE
jgi:serine/threonine protein phosphatase 1